MKRYRYRGYTITGIRGKWGTYVSGQDVTESTLAKVKRTIDVLEFAGTRAK